MTGIEVRLEEPRDRLDALRVEELAFGGPAEAAIVEAVRDLEGSFALVATDDDAVIGHVQMSRAWIADRPVLALGPIGVLPERQGSGVGSTLVGASLDEARRRGEVAVMLLGSPDFYLRFGFQAASRWGLHNPFAGVSPDGFVIEEEHFMVAALVEPAPVLAGEVWWHPAFGEPVEAPGEPR